MRCALSWEANPAAVNDGETLQKRPLSAAVERSHRENRPDTCSITAVTLRSRKAGSVRTDPR